jgi:Derlin-2/3
MQALNVPLSSYTHTRPLLLTLTYLSSVLAPPGTQTNLMGLITFPIMYLPYGMVAMDLVMGGPGAAASGVSGLVVGHLWWWAVFGGGAAGTNGRVGGWARAPGWVRNVVGNGAGPASGGAGAGSGGGGGVHVLPPRTETTTSSGGHQWGSGHRLGS